jgi:general secretion pathway protein M
MLGLGRKEIFAVGGFGGLMLVCAITIVVALNGSMEASSNLAEQRDQLTRLEARLRTAGDRREQAHIAAAPVRAFLDAPTSGLAAAQLQAYLSRLVADQQAALVSSGVPPADRNEAGDTIRLQIALNATLPALQSLLYRLESGVPYIFVDTLSMQTGASGERATANPVLKVTLNLHAFWRRAKA